MSYEVIDMKSKSSNSIYLSIVIPVYNEADNVKILYKDIRNAIDSLKKNYEIIFVDDGSNDKTFENLNTIKRIEENQKETLARMKILRLSRNFGQTAAMQAGFENCRGKVIITMDGDLQNNPADIPRMLKKIEQGYDLVCGWRKNRKDKTATRILPSKIANWLIRKAIGIQIHDIGCSLKGYKIEMIKSVKLYSDMHRFIPVVTSMKGARIAEVVVNHRPRQFGKPKYGLSRTWKVLSDLLTLKMLANFLDRPFRWFSIFSSVFGVLGVILGIASVVILFRGIESLVFPASSFLSFFLSGSLVSWGLLAEYFISQEKQ
jgi:glycosyltransferase involved in cell wall biosynthesis